VRLCRSRVMEGQLWPDMENAVKECVQEPNTLLKTRIRKAFASTLESASYGGVNSPMARAAISMRQDFDSEKSM